MTDTRTIVTLRAALKEMTKAVAELGPTCPLCYADLGPYRTDIGHDPECAYLHARAVLVATKPRLKP